MIEISNEQELAAFAAKLVPLLKRGDVVCLHGDLGAGKTAFARALIRAAMGAEVEVPSPTFTLVQTYDLPKFTLWHFDLYRLEEKEADVLELGWDDARREGVCLVEWPERLGRLLPKDRLDISLGFVPGHETRRQITLTPQGSWVTRNPASSPLW